MPVEMMCPSCHSTLEIAERQGIEIDYCPRCRGVWLDRGELDKIIDRSLSFSSQKDRRRGEDDDFDSRRRRWEDEDREEYREARKRRRGSFLSEIFDFD